MSNFLTATVVSRVACIGEVGQAGGGRWGRMGRLYPLLGLSRLAMHPDVTLRWVFQNTVTIKLYCINYIIYTKKNSCPLNLDQLMAHRIHDNYK